MVGPLPTNLFPAGHPIDKAVILAKGMSCLPRRAALQTGYPAGKEPWPVDPAGQTSYFDFELLSVKNSRCLISKPAHMTSMIGNGGVNGPRLRQSTYIGVASASKNRRD